MRYFRKMAAGLPVGAACADVLAPDFEARVTDRASRFGFADPVAIGEAGGIYPRGTPIAMWFNYFDAPTPALQTVVSNAMAFLPPDERFREAAVAVLPPYSSVKSHVDHGGDGLPATRRRYHLFLQVDRGFMFDIAGERCRFETGDLWRVDTGSRSHFTVNNSPHRRASILISTMTDFST